MAFSAVRVGPAQFGNSNATLFTVNNAAGAALRSVEFFNTDTAQRWWSLAINGTGATASNCWRYQQGLQTGQGTSFSLWIPLAHNDTIQGLAEVASKMNYILGVVYL
jgi:hypothetical protein